MSMADQRLVSIVDRLVRLEEERRALAADMKDIRQEAKSAGYNVAALGDIVKERLETAKQKAAREDRETARDLMRNALGDFASSPLGTAAVGAA
jgi:uncharacterized protein (UPF0335 family)